MTLEELRAASPQLAAFVTETDPLGRRTYLAAFQGPGGLFAVYEIGMPLGAVVKVCTMRERPVLVQIEGVSVGMARKTALLVAKALATGFISGERRGPLLLVSEEDADKAYETA